ncbi:MAG: ImuA family protein [Beijerinckiaceae bacterium]
MFGTALAPLLNGGLARGAVHEVLAASPGDLAAAAGFVLALAIRFVNDRQNDRQAPIVWISEDFATRENGALYGPGLALHGLDPESLVLVQAPNAKEALWGLEEALKCRASAVVIGEIWSFAKAYDLTASRRLVLAAQNSGTPCLLFAAGLTGAADQLSSSAETRFEIRASPSPQLASAAGRLPLPGLAAWSVRIAKARASPLRIDRGLFRPVLWDHVEALFRDALSLSLAPLSRDGSDHPAVGQTRNRQRA